MESGDDDDVAGVLRPALAEVVVDNDASEATDSLEFFLLGGGGGLREDGGLG